jgi:hypothetical protein
MASRLQKEWTFKEFLNCVKQERERARRVRGVVVRDITCNGEQKNIYGYEGPQAVPARPSGKGRLGRR